MNLADFVALLLEAAVGRPPPSGWRTGTPSRRRNPRNPKWRSERSLRKAERRAAALETAARIEAEGVAPRYLHAAARRRRLAEQAGR